jgi:hypothetical protein
MKQSIGKRLPMLLIISLIALLAGAAYAESKVTITGVISDDGQLIGSDGVIYEIAENDMGIELIDRVGAQVVVEGTLMESDELLIITVIRFE